MLIQTESKDIIKKDTTKMLKSQGNRLGFIIGGIAVRRRRSSYNLTSSSYNHVAWRRAKVMELYSKGHTQMEIAHIMQVSQVQIHKDIQFCREQAKAIMKKYLDQYLPEEFHKCLLGVDNVLKLAWSIIDSSQQNTREDKQARLAAAQLVNQCISLKSELLSNVDVIQGAMNFIDKNSRNQKEQQQHQHIQPNDNNNIIV
jgi:hypothetical protein